MNHKPLRGITRDKTKKTLEVLKASKKYMSPKEITDKYAEIQGPSDGLVTGMICNILSAAGLLIRKETFKGNSMRVVYKIKEQNESL